MNNVNTTTKYIIVIVTAISLLIAGLLAARLLYAPPEKKAPEGGAATPSQPGSPGNCNLEVFAVNRTANYRVEGCRVHVSSNDTFVVLWIAVPYHINNGAIKVDVETKNPVSLIFEYAPSGVNVTGTRIVVPVKDELNLEIIVKSGGVDQVMASGRPIGRTISPYVLRGPRGRNLLKVTLWGPFGVDTDITLQGTG